MAIIRDIRFEDASTVARIHVDTWRTTYADIVPAEHLASLSYESAQKRCEARISEPFPGSFTLVAESDPGCIVGFAIAGTPQQPYGDFDAELHVIYVLQADQGRGFGKLLVKHVVQRLISQGLRAMVVWVFAENASCQFYEALGAVKVGEANLEVGGKSLLEVAYGWSDLKLLDKLIA